MLCSVVIRWTSVVCALLGVCGDFASAMSTVPVKRHRLEGRASGFVPAEKEQWLVVAFLGIECPLAKLYVGRLNELAAQYESRGVGFIAVDANEQDSPDEMAAFAQAHKLRFPFVKDRTFQVVDYFKATRTPEVFVVGRRGKVHYRGRIDDRYQVGLHRDDARRDPNDVGDLARALDELTAGRDVTVSETRAVGCLLTRPKPNAAAPGEITYLQHIAPLLHAKCVRCHQSDEVGPMSLTDYDTVVGWASMIDEVVSQDRMPPWHAERGVGHFKNDASLTFNEKQLLRSWIAAGCPRGSAASARPLPKGPDPSVPTDERFQAFWQIGRPDAIVSIPEPFTVPASGTIEYQYFDVDPGFTEDRWISACEVRPTNRAVLHHCNVFLRPPESDEVVEQGSLGSYCLTAMAAGTPAMQLPAGMAKRIPAGWHLVFVVHYVAVGTEQVDRLSLALKFVQPNRVEREAATRLLIDEHLEIPPGASDHQVEHATTIERDLLLVAMFPHMHLRGKSFRYEATYPDGRTQVLLNVPRWDFAWQHRYELAEPKLLPRGTTLRCVAHYDNSAANPANPDPTATVVTGPRSDDEMFNGYYDVALAEPEYPSRKKNSYWFVTITLVCALVLLRRKGRASSLGAHLSRN